MLRLRRNRLLVAMALGISMATTPGQGLCISDTDAEFDTKTVGNSVGLFGRRIGVDGSDEHVSDEDDTDEEVEQKTGLLRCWEVSWAVGDPMVSECESYFWTMTVDGPRLLEHGSPGKPEPGVNIPAPTPEEIIEYAAATVRAAGAGLVVQPAGGVLVGVPTLVHAGSPEQVLSTSLFGTGVEVSLKATRFSYDFGDGSESLVTSDPGAPYPYRGLAHSYANRMDAAVVTLTTTWSGTVTSPFTGETASIDGVVTTRESSAPFAVREARIDLVKE